MGRRGWRTDQTLSNEEEKHKEVLLSTAHVHEVVFVNLGWCVEKGTPMEKADRGGFNGRSEHVQGGIKVAKVDGDLENMSGRVADVFEAAKEEASQALNLGKILGVSCGPNEAEIFQSLIEAEISKARGKFPLS